jgi:hypothetical protein
VIATIDFLLAFGGYFFVLLNSFLKSNLISSSGRAHWIHQFRRKVEQIQNEAWRGDCRENQIP